MRKKKENKVASMFNESDYNSLARLSLITQYNNIPDILVLSQDTLFMLMTSVRQLQLTTVFQYFSLIYFILKLSVHVS